MTMRDNRTGIQVIARAAAILRSLNEADGLSLGQLAQKLQLPRSTVQRIVGALASEGLAATDGGAGNIRIGPAISGLAGRPRADIAQLCRPHLEALSAKTRETVDLARLDGDHLIFIDQIIGTQRLRTVSSVGERFPLHCTANGKAALSCLNRADALALAKGDLRRFTPNSLTSLSRLRSALDEVRTTGIAYDLEEHSLGISAIGVGFQSGQGGSVHAISVPMPTQRFAAKQKSVTAAIVAARAGILAELERLA